jgi:hypothetical protein
MTKHRTLLLKQRLARDPRDPVLELREEGKRAVSICCRDFTANVEMKESHHLPLPAYDAHQNREKAAYPKAQDAALRIYEWIMKG